MNEIKAFQARDGALFLTKNQALAHENQNQIWTFITKQAGCGRSASIEIIKDFIVKNPDTLLKFMKEMFEEEVP